MRCAVLLLLGCSFLMAAEPLPVVTTGPILADIASQVGGHRVQVQSLMPVGQDPHEWQPTASDVRRVASANVVLAMGLGLDGWLDPLVRQAGGQAPIACASGIELLTGEQADHADHHIHEHDHGHGHGHTHGGVDPHVWLDPRNGAIIARTIATAFAAADPAGAADYAAWSEAYVAQLRTVEAWTRRQLATIPPTRRVLVLAHASAGYFAKAFDLTVIGASGITTDQEPAAAALAALAKDLRERGVTTVFSESGQPPALLDRLADEAGATVRGPLYTETLGPIGTQAGTYLGMFLHNGRMIAEGLGADR